MSKLIGTNPNQVPSNADLGSAAFMDAKDFLTARGSSLSAIDTIIPKTAVDVFIYDTSKDSDGGAWRKRTQHTSWYNERLNTTTRGSRREFPAVAVIVATTSSVMIYDGDDPTLPMWMVFSYQSGAGWIAYLNVTYLGTAISSISAMNGVLGIGVNNSSYGGFLFGNFLADNGGILYYGYDELKFDGYISDRNSIYSGQFISSRRIVNRGVNDVAMTVLPNAPIDSATGLPVPTIAVATNGGVSVIKDDGTVISTASSIYAVGSIQILPTGEIYHSQGYSGNNGFCYNDNFERLNGLDVGTYANSSTFWYAIDGIGNDSSLLGGGLADENAVGEGLDTAVGTASGLTAIALNSSSLNDGMVAWRTSNYNTGWMPGDIKLATLSDTDDTDVNGSELVTNGTFDTNTSGWTAHNGTVNLSVSSGALVITTTSASYGYAYQSIAGLTVGKTYTATLNFLSASASTWVRLGTAFDGQTYYGTTPPTGIVNVTFTATSSTLYITLVIGAGSAGLTCSFDDISVRLAEEDRSVNDNGLQVFGTVKKTLVAAGADLVAYSGFSQNNYLKQPYNADMNVGTGSFSIMGWINYSSVSTFNYLLERQPGKLELYIGPSDILVSYIGGAQLTNPRVLTKNVWNHICVTRLSSGTATMFINGNQVTTGSTPGNINVTDGSGIVFGSRGDGNGFYPFVNGSMSLWRVSATAPSAEQIKKIYEDEKFLFQENAKATLYGTSDAVTALAYDDSTELLHAGTSAGRSVFQGLRRVDNTTDAVGAAISAVNGMVVEE